MKQTGLRVALGAGVISGLMFVADGCGGSKPPPPADVPADSGPDIGIVNSTVVIDSCPDAKTINQKNARAAIGNLVSPCSQVPGGAAHFSATLMPGGRIVLASPSGDTADGVVPTCVLSKQLTHRVLLKKPCKFDVQLEERKMNAE